MLSAAGRRLQEIREGLGLTLRDVDIAITAIAKGRGIEEFIINPSRLSDLEGKGVTPGLHRFYILSVLYRTDLADLLKMYGIDLAAPIDERAIQTSKKLRNIHVPKTYQHPGKALRQIRESIGLTLRDVEVASAHIAELHGIEELIVNPSRLSDIEMKMVVPSIYRLYVLSVIYQLGFTTLLRLYEMDSSKAQSDFDLVPEEIKQRISEQLSSDISITFDPNLSAEQVKTTLQALADYYRACGGLGFQIDLEFEEILTKEPVYV